MLNEIKLALRISHNHLDYEILGTIETARTELIRSGISADKANSSDDRLIANAIKTYCLYAYSNDSKMSEGYFTSWKYQLENLRKTSGYMQESDSNV